MSDQIKAVMDEASKKRNFRCRGAGSSEEVIAFEKKLKILLPDDYKFFLENYGYAVWRGDVVCGIIDEDDLFYPEANAISKTQYYHKLYDSDPEFLSVSSEGVVINQYDGGGYYFLFSNDSNRAGEVGLFLTESWGKEVHKFNSFIDFLSYLVNGEPNSIAV